MAQKKACGSKKLICNRCRISCNITSRTTYWSDFQRCGAMEVVQELCEVPEQVMYKRYTCVAGTPAEKL